MGESFRFRAKKHINNNECRQGNLQSCMFDIIIWEENFKLVGIGLKENTLRENIG